MAISKQEILDKLSALKKEKTALLQQLKFLENNPPKQQNNKASLSDFLR